MSSTPETAAEKFDRLVASAQHAPSGADIVHTALDLAQMLVDKNAAYGDSISDPVRIFSKSTPEEQIANRVDDKLSRAKRGHEYPGDNTIKDLAGYFILWVMLRERPQSVRSQSGNTVEETVTVPASNES